MKFASGVGSVVFPFVLIENVCWMSTIIYTELFSPLRECSEYTRNASVYPGVSVE